MNAFLKLGPLETLRVLLSYVFARLRPIKPEYLTDYEVGEKADFLDNRLRVNTAAT